MATKAAPPGGAGKRAPRAMREENTERDRRCHEHDDRTPYPAGPGRKGLPDWRQKESSAGFPALSGVDLTIATGELVAITGPSGSGKTTIINLIAGIDRPSAGTVTVAGSRLDQMSEEQLAVWRGQHHRHRLPVLPADAHAHRDRERDTAARPGKARASRQRKDTASRNLAAVGLAERGDRLPLELSGGEQQRVAIARAMACQPPILLGDEPPPATSTRAWRATCSRCSRT